MIRFTIVLGCLLSFVSVSARAELRADKVQVAEAKKTQAYMKDGLIVGGDRAINEVIVKDLRRAANAGYERIVLDVSGNHNGEAVAISRPPYYQVAVTPDEKRIIFTLWGKPKLMLDAKKVKAAFAKSNIVNDVELFPVLDDESWTFLFELKSPAAVEVFELGDPVRIIIDLKGELKGSSAKALAHKVVKTTVKKVVHPVPEPASVKKPALPQSKPDEFVAPAFEPKEEIVKEKPVVKAQDKADSMPLDMPSDKPAHMIAPTHSEDGDTKSEVKHEEKHEEKLE